MDYHFLPRFPVTVISQWVVGDTLFLFLSTEHEPIHISNL